MSTKNTPLILGTEPIGKLLAQYAIPAIALTFPLMNLAAAFGSLVGVGASTLVSVKLGQKDYWGANLVLGNVFMLNLIMGIAFSVIFLLCLDPLLYFFGASEQTISYARDYMQVILYGNVVTHMYLGLNSILRSSGFPKMAMYMTLVSVVVNCALNPLFIFVFGWGIKGSAWATVISQFLSLVWQFVHFMRPSQLLHFQRGIYKYQKEIVNGILSIGLSPFLMNLCACLIVLLINWGLKEYGGDMAIGAYGIVNRIVFLFVMIIMGFNQGMQPIAGYNFGARQFPRVMEVTRLTTRWAVGLATAGFLICHLFPETIVGFFTSDAELIQESVFGLHLVFAVFPIVGFQMVASNFFLSIGLSRKAIFLSLTRQLLFLVPCLIILPPLWGTFGVWVSIPIADTTATIVTAIVLVRQFKQFKEMEVQRNETNHSF